jgi:hypothetical protein
LHDRKVGGLGARKNSSDIDAHLPVRVDNATAVAHQAADRGELTLGPDRGQCVPARECDELFRPSVEQCDGGNSESSYLLLKEGCEGRLEIAFGASFDDHQFPPERMRRSLRISRVGLGIRNMCVREKADHRGMWNQLVQQLELLRHQHAAKEAHAGGVAARPVEAGHET